LKGQRNKGKERKGTQERRDRERQYTDIKEVVKEGHRRMQKVWTENNISR